MEETKDDFSFDEFLSDETKQGLGIVTETSVPQDVQPPVETPVENVEQASEVVVPTEIPKIEEVETKQQTSDVPVKTIDEPDWKYEYRLEIWEKQQLLKQAKSDSERIEIKNDINSVRKEIAQRAKEQVPEFDPNDIEQVIERKLEMREQVKNIDQAESDFIKRHPEMRNESLYNSFVEYVADTYNIQNKSYKALTAILESSYETLYPKNIQERINKAKEVEQKIQAVDFSGSSATPDTPTEKQGEQDLVKNIKSNSGNDFSWIL
jgi:hypothetical protein